MSEKNRRLVDVTRFVSLRETAVIFDMPIPLPLFELQSNGYNLDIGI